MRSRRDYFRDLAVKFGLRPDHHNMNDFITMATSHEYFGEARIVERILGARSELSRSAFIDSFLRVVSEEELIPIHLRGKTSSDENGEYARLPPENDAPNAHVKCDICGKSVNGPIKCMVCRRADVVRFEGPIRLDFEQLQTEHMLWLNHNFPEQLRDPARRDDGFDGLVEEVGELARARLKARQGIRGTPEEHRAAAIDAIGDIVIFLTSYCTANGFNLQECVERTWNHVKQRDWKKYPETGFLTLPPYEA